MLDPPEPIQPSAIAAARLIASGCPPPSQIGGCGFCTGFGDMLRALERVDSAAVVDLRLGPQRLDQLDLLEESPDAALARNLELLVVVVAAQSHAEDRPAVARVVERRDLVREMDGIAHGQDDHRDAHTDPRRDRGRVGQDHDRVEAEDVVERVLRHPQIAESERVGALGDLAHGRHVDRVGGAVGQRHAERDPVFQGHHQSSLEARRAPSTSEPSLRQTMLVSTWTLPANVPKPQSTPAMTFSRPITPA